MTATAKQANNGGRNAFAEIADDGEQTNGRENPDVIPQHVRIAIVKQPEQHNQIDCAREGTHNVRCNDSSSSHIEKADNV